MREGQPSIAQEPLRASEPVDDFCEATQAVFREGWPGAKRRRAGARQGFATPPAPRKTPRVTMLIDFPFQQTSELMRDRTSHRGTWMPIAANARRTRDGEVPFIR